MRASSRDLFLRALEETLECATDGEERSMPSFSQLPPELLPLILGHLRYRQGELARTRLVCREWAHVSKPVRVCGGWSRRRLVGKVELTGP